MDLVDALSYYKIINITNGTALVIYAILTGILVLLLSYYKDKHRSKNKICTNYGENKS